MWVVGLVALLAWSWLLTRRAGYWRAEPRLEADVRADTETDTLPSVCAIVPARNEAQVLPETLTSLLNQEYKGAFRVVLVDDHSTDGTAEVAREVARRLGRTDLLQVVGAEALPEGWSGKLWAMERGLRVTEGEAWDCVLFTDADIRHPGSGLSTLASRMRQGGLALVSVMVHLRVESFWDRLTLPAFVYFFAQLYPFRWSNDPGRRTAAAAGGCMLVHRGALESSGGLEPIAGELIDDCALAKQLKEHGARTWLGLSRAWASVRAYGRLGETWNMVVRTAFHQLRYSVLNLAGCVIGMGLLYFVPPVLCGLALFSPDLSPGARVLLGLTAALAWGEMSLSFVPTLRWYGLSRLYAPLLPLSAGLYTLMTVHSAFRHWAGRGGAWKGRVYSGLGKQKPGPSDSEG